MKKKKKKEFNPNYLFNENKILLSNYLTNLNYSQLMVLVHSWL